MPKRRSLQHEIETLSPHRSLHEYREASLTAVDFDRYARLVSSLLKAEISAITFLDEENQHRLAETNLNGTRVLSDTVDKKNTVCQYTVQQDQEALVVSDLSQDERFEYLNCVKNGPKFRTYAGFPIKVREGFNIGAVCAIDAQTRQWKDSEITVLQDISRMISNDLNLHFLTQSVLTQQRMQSSIVLFIQANLEMIKVVRDSKLPLVPNSSKICENAAQILQDTLEVDAVYLLRKVSLLRQEVHTGIETEVFGTADMAEPRRRRLLFTSEPFCGTLQIDQVCAIYDKTSLPPELYTILGPSTQAAMVSSWSAIDGLPGGLIVVKTNSENHVFRAMHQDYLKAFGSTLKLELQKDKIVDTDRAKTEFISSLSHELRTPLHGLLHNAEVLLETSLDAEQSELLREITACGNAQLDIVESMLDLRTARGRKNLFVPLETPDHVDLLELVEDVVSKAIDGHARKKWNQVGADEQTDQFEVLVDCPMQSGTDQLRCRITHRKSMQQILSHLISNSLKWTHSGFVKIEMDLSHSKDEAPLVLINVCDTGAGIDAEFLRNKLFQSFSKEDSFTSGLGLGLSVVADLVSQLHGTIKIDSEKGAFTTVRLAIPMAISATNIAKPLFSRPMTSIGILSSPDKTNLGEQHLVTTVGRDLRDLGYSVSHYTEMPKEHDLIALVTTQPISGSLKAEKIPIIYAGRLITKALMHSHLETTALRNTLGPFYGLRKLSQALLRAFEDDKQTRPMSKDKSRKREHSAEFVTQHDFRRRGIHKFPNMEHPSDSTAAEYSPAQTCPSSPERPRERSTIDSPSPSARGSSNSPGPSGDPRVLIVEDNPLNSRLLTRFMEKCGYDYDAVFNGQEAVETVRSLAAKDVAFDVILMDIQMPILDGLSATERIRHIEASTHMKSSYIVACTGLSASEDKQKAAQVGCNNFLTKPISLTTLRQIFVDWRHSRLLS